MLLQNLSYNSFVNLCRNITCVWYKRNHIDMSFDRICLQWYCGTASEQKAIVVATDLNDGLCFEYYYNAKEEKIYQNVYKKVIGESFGKGDTIYKENLYKEN